MAVSMVLIKEIYRNQTICDIYKKKQPAMIYLSGNILQV
jgi:hypothetical protein